MPAEYFSVAKKVVNINFFIQRRSLLSAGEYAFPEHHNLRKMNKPSAVPGNGHRTDFIKMLCIETGSISRQAEKYRYAKINWQIDIYPAAMLNTSQYYTIKVRNT